MHTPLELAKIPTIQVKDGTWRKHAEAIHDVVASQSWVKELARSKIFTNLLSLHFNTQTSRSINQEIAQVSKESGVSIDELRAVNLTYEICMFGFAGVNLDITKLLLTVFKPVRAGCTSIIFDDDPKGSPLHMRNLDWPDPSGMLSKHLIIAERKRKDGKVWRSIQWPGFAHTVTALAPTFSISMNAVWCEELAWGKAPTALMRNIAENCDSWQEALQKLKTTPINCGALFTLAGTKHGESAFVERTPRRFVSTERQPLITVTNDYQKLKTATVHDNSEVAETSCSRQNRVRDLMEGKNGYKKVKGQAKGMDDFPTRVISDQEVMLNCTLHHTKMIPSTGTLEAWRPLVKL